MGQEKFLRALQEACEAAGGDAADVRACAAALLRHDASRSFEGRRPIAPSGLQGLMPARARRSSSSVSSESSVAPPVAKRPRTEVRIKRYFGAGWTLAGFWGFYAWR